KSSGFLLHVMKGQRNLTRPVALGIARAMGLTAAQTEYFEDLVSFGQAKLQSDKEYYLERIAAKRKGVKIEALDDRQYEFYSAWHHSVIRELVTLVRKNYNPALLAKLLVPAITPKQAKESLKLQEELGILKKRRSGRYCQAKPFVSGGGPVRNTAVIKFQKEMLEHAKGAWDRFKAEEATMHTETLCMSEELVERIRQEIREFKERLMEMVASEKRPPERVFHLNINLFPVTRSVRPHPALSLAEREKTAGGK
ncbi:MAG: TIGR02147 family protein, partial [Chitinispirillaceae bacterium]|nr:TIGR02147 family protein [Chitinispirillaceae bacterium]